MKIFRYFLSAFFVLLFVNLSAQSIRTLSFELNWQGIERWYVNDDNYIDVLTFEGAQHINTLPHFHYAEPTDDSFSFNVWIENPVFIPLEADEIPFLEGIHPYDHLKIETYVSSTRRSNNAFNISIFPFVLQDGEILKLKSFDLVLEQVPNYTSSLRTYPENSILASGRFFRVQITETGVHRISHADLRNRGIDPANVRMFGFGGAKLNEDSTAPYTSDLPEIAIHDTGSAILFFAQGVNSWTFENNAFVHTLNPYSLHGHYFITSDNIGERRRIATRSEIDSSDGMLHDVVEFTDFQVHERELHSMIRSGRHFFGERFTHGMSIQIPFSFPNLISSEPVRARIHVVNSTSSAPFRLTLNNQQRTIHVIGQSTISNQNFNNVPNGNLNFTLQYLGEDVGFLNFLSVNVQRQLRMVGNFMPFHNTRNIGANSFNQYFLETNNNNIQIWDVSDQRNVQRIPTRREGNYLVFIDSASEVKSYLAIDPTNLSNIPSAVILNEVPNQNIHGMGPVDMLIITHPLFLAPAERLAQAHAENPANPLRVAVVTTEQVYNEFSSGTRDATAYRWAAKMFYDRAQTEADRIRYLLLFGNGHFDNRGILPATTSNLVLTFQSENSWSDTASFVTDDYFALLEDGKGTRLETTDRLDIAVGRFPVVTLADANGVVNKTIAYMRGENNGGWQNQLVFIGEDNADGWNNMHMRQSNSLADRTSRANPSFHVNKIMMDAFQQTTNASGRTFPAANSHFQNLLRSGVLLVHYMGHANASGLAGARIFTARDANELRNRHLHLFTAGTCDWSRFDGDVVSGGEEIVRNPHGGGIGSFAPARLVFADRNYSLLQIFMDSLFQVRDEPISIGEAIRLSKNATGTAAAIGQNRIKFMYFGDPAVRLRQPNQNKILVTEINGNAVAGNDTLRALSHNTVRGIITNRAGVKQNHFNGTVQIIILDKEITISTMRNTAHTPEQPLFLFQDRPHTLFRGTAEVINGEFEFDFLVPRNILFNYGGGRMVFNAWSSENNFDEAQGHFEDFIVGGSEKVTLTTEGPKVRMYLNHPAFVSGGRVNETPIFIAHISDEYGINISSPVPGHDVLLMIENRSFVLNSYFEAHTGTFRAGTVNFQMPELPEGRHQLMFRVWNLHGVSTVEYLDFEIVRNLQPEIFSVSAFPNPATTEVNFQVVHDRAEEIISMTAEVFDLTGRRIWSRTEESAPIIRWNIEGENGGRVSPGMYIYRISITDGRRISSSQSGRIIIR